MNLNFWLINERMANDPSFYPVANFMNSGFFNDNSKNNQKLFYFEYDRKIFNFEKMKNKEIVKKKIEQIRVKKINSDEIILREKIRLKMKSYILKFIN